MNAPSQRPSTNPERLAPSVDRGWVRAFVTEQNLRGVSPRDIGDQLATVESHVQESGESADDAFGDAVAYARALAGDSRWRLEVRTVVELALGLAGMLLVNRAFGAWLVGEPWDTVTTGDVAVAGLLTAGTAVLLARPDAVLRLVVERPVLAWGLSMLPLAVFVSALLLLRTELAPLPIMPVAVVGAAALVASSVAAYLDHEPDEITGPGEAPRRSPAARRVGVWSYPLLTVGLMAITWVQTLFT